ncbi:class I SAM-dependent methyltransferase [Methanosarcina sp.]|jgi:O-antigen chain-terminating methyltransferase|uniref:class I SAM-dependent methyltransferase n=1 Tax=Methanosarcina sp. TaxID=2213 RepID=UPI002CE291CE|nr:class I SAM-dependent methyltransferase [Methanosarcina sp.]HOW14882.1 class I SAM-dependent methyltransferase [Methanosarcina sp.]
MNTFEIHDDEINAKEILEKIRENIQSRKKTGAYSESIPCLTATNSEKNFIPAVNGMSSKDLEYLTSNYDVQNRSYVISSHRPVTGFFLVKGRNLVNGEVKRYVDPVFAQQSELNACTCRILTELLCKNEELSGKNEELFRKYEELSGKHEDSLGANEELLGKYNELLEQNRVLDSKINTLDTKLVKLDKVIKNAASNVVTSSGNVAASTPWGNYYSEEISEEDLLGNINHHKHFISVVEDYAQKASENRVPKLIEVGIGTATMSIYFSRQKYEVLGLDNDINVIFNAMATNRKLGGHANFVMMDANFLDQFKNKYFDVAFSQGTLEHFDNDGIINMLSKQLEAAKYVVFSVPSIHYPEREFGNERKMTTEEWEVILKDGGLHVEKLEYYREDTQIVCVVTDDNE